MAFHQQEVSKIGFYGPRVYNGLSWFIF